MALVTVEAVMCLAACDKAPMFQVQTGDGLQYYENQTVESALALIEIRWRNEGGGSHERVTSCCATGRFPALDKLEVYRQNDGFQAFQKAVTSMQPDEVIDVVKASGLRGRGGAGFPTGMKWSFIDNNNLAALRGRQCRRIRAGHLQRPRDHGRQSLPVPGRGGDLPPTPSRPTPPISTCAASSGRSPHQLDQRIAAMEAAGLLGDNLFGTDYSLRMYTHLGAGAYICGEETALLESLEGKLGQPRLRPPFPPSFGLYGKPTVVNNVETLTNVPLIIDTWRRLVSHHRHGEKPRGRRSSRFRAA